MLRSCGILHHGVLEGRHTLAEVAVYFSLRTAPSIYREITEGEAELLLTHILHKDLAYGTVLISREEAACRARMILSPVSTKPAKYYTNCEYNTGAERILIDGGRWNPATHATFDTGVIFVAADIAGCFWVEDED